jgi:hypothetical protein
LNLTVLLAQLRLHPTPERAGSRVVAARIIVCADACRLSSSRRWADLLNDLKAGGYKIVFMKPKYSVTTIASYDEVILKQLKGPMPDSRPTSSVVRTISE